MVFDDTFRHEAWNPSSEKTRIVLMFDIFCEVEETHRNPVFMDLSKKRGYSEVHTFFKTCREMFGEEALISSDLIQAFATLGGTTENARVRPEDTEFP